MRKLLLVGALILGMSMSFAQSNEKGNVIIAKISSCAFRGGMTIELYDNGDRIKYLECRKIDVFIEEMMADGYKLLSGNLHSYGSRGSLIFVKE